MSNLVKEKSPSAPATTIAVAASGKKDSKLALRWALENFISDGRRIISKILHVRPKITSVPSLMGPIPLTTVHEDVASAYIAEVESKANEMLAPYQRLCAQRKVEAEFLVIEADDVVAAISAEVAKSGIRKLSTARTASLPINKVAEFDKDRPSVSFNSFSGYASAAQTGWSDAVLAEPQLHALSLLDQRYWALLTVNQYNNSGVASAINMTHSRASRIHDEGAFSSNVSAHAEVHEESNGASDKKICKASNRSGASSQSSLSDGPTGSSFSNNEISGELKKLRVELHRVQEMFKMAEEKSDTSGKASALNSHKTELGLISTEEEKARELTKYENEKREVAEEEAEFVKECLEKELIQKREAVVMASHEAKEKHKLAHLDHQFEKFGWEEISSATSSFSDSLTVGEGAFGVVYKCTLRHITVAVKVLKAIEIQKDKQFLRELEILSRIRHPHLLMLIGACPDHGCTVFEYMENGSLDDRLRRKNGPPPISANILLDHNLVSKIGDVGLCTLIPTDHSTMATVSKNTALVGTYVMLIQSIKELAPMGLAHFVEKAIEEDHLEEILDDGAGRWPIKEAKELAHLRLRDREKSSKAISLGPPSHFLCPILQDVMEEPWVAPDATHMSGEL